MFGWLRRLFGIANAEAHAAINKLEDPIKMTEQGIRDLKNDLNKSLQSLAEVKAMHIRAKKDLELSLKSEEEYENKAILLLQKAESGEMSPDEADRLAALALEKKEQLSQRSTATKKNVTHYEPMVKKMEVNVQKLKEQISSWENELKTLKARAKVSEATKNLNKQIANVDSSSTLARLERMREKVAEQESLAESYGDIADMNTSVDDEINKALGSSSTVGNESLAKLKAKMAEGKVKRPSASNDSKGGPNTSGTPGGATKKSTDLDELKQKLKDSKENGAD